MKNKDDFIQKVCAVSRLHFNQGNLSEKQFDEKRFIKDMDLKNISRELNFTYHQYHLMISAVSHHFELRKKEIVRRNKLYKKISGIAKK